MGLKEKVILNITLFHDYMNMGMFKVTYIKGELTFHVEKLKFIDKLNKTCQLRKYLMDHDETMGGKNRDV